jgi:hypothetical protein
MRSLLLHWTPFLPWYLNVRDVPVQGAPGRPSGADRALADINAAEEQWRKDHHLSLLQGNHVPDFLLGGYTEQQGQASSGSRTTPRSVSAPT